MVVERPRAAPPNRPGVPGAGERSARAAAAGREAGRTAVRDVVAGGRAGAVLRRRLAPVALALLVSAPAVGRAAERLVSAFSTVGVLGPSGETPSVTLYVVPEGRTLGVPGVPRANHGQAVVRLCLADSGGTRCSIALLQTTLLAGAGGFYTLSNPYTTFTSGIPFGPGEPVIATLANGTHGVDV